MPFPDELKHYEEKVGRIKLGKEWRKTSENEKKKFSGTDVNTTYLWDLHGKSISLWVEPLKYFSKEWKKNDGEIFLRFSNRDSDDHKPARVLSLDSLIYAGLCSDNQTPTYLTTWSQPFNLFIV